MKNPELFHKTVGILVNCYFKQTLRHFNCYACAVGNMVAANCGIGYKTAKESMYGIVYETQDADAYDPNSPSVGWFRIAMNADSGYFIDETFKQCEATGYAIPQLIEIERAFESANPNMSTKVDTDGYNGLMKVLDILMSIHEANIEEITEAKSLFVKELAE